MNADRRKELSKAIELLEQAKDIVTSIQEQEQEAYDNLSEGLQASGMGERLQENADDLDYIDFDEIIDSIQDVIDR